MLCLSLSLSCRKKMNVWLIPSSLSTTPTTLSTPHHHHHLHLPIIPTKLSLHNTLLATTLSFGLFFSSIPSSSSASALQPPPLPIPLSPSSETCLDVELRDITLPTAPEVVTNEGLVQEAWQIVNDDFLDTGRHRWSQDTWQVTSLFISLPIHLKIFYFFFFFILDQFINFYYVDFGLQLVHITLPT